MEDIKEKKTRVKRKIVLKEPEERSKNTDKTLGKEPILVKVSKGLGISRKIKKITQYSGDVGLYDLSKPALLKALEDVKFLVIAKAKSVSGGDAVTVFASNEEGLINSNRPVLIRKGAEISSVLKELGFTLI